MSELIVAAKNGYSRQVQQLIDIGCSVDVTDKDNATPLYWAACLGHRQICEFLLQAQCDVNARVNWGSTALHAACDRRHADCVKLLIQWRAYIDVQNSRGDTPLHLAAYRGFQDIVLILINTKADARIKNNSGKTPLQEALSQDHKQTANLLQEYTRNLSQFSSLPEMKSDMSNLRSVSSATSWPQYHKSADGIRNIYQNGQEKNSYYVQNQTAYTGNELNYSNDMMYSSANFQTTEPVAGLNQLSYTNSYQQQRTGPSNTINGRILPNGNKDNLDEVDGFLMQNIRVCEKKYCPPLMTNGHPKINRSPENLHEAELALSSQGESRQSSAAIENYAESLQFELVKFSERVVYLEKEKADREKKMLELAQAHKTKEKEAENLKKMLATEHAARRVVKQQLSELQRKQSTVTATSRAPLPWTENPVTHKYLLKFIKNSNCHSDHEHCYLSLQKEVREMWTTQSESSKLDIDNREWVMGKDYELVCDRPINHISDGIRNGSCSLVFQIKRHGKPYILKMMINLINLDFDRHSDGYSLDSHLIRNFGMEYHVPLLLDKYPNIVKVLHHYEGSTEHFLQFQNLLVPNSLDVPVEMARRTTFIVMETYPQSLQQFMITQRTVCPSPSFGLPNVFLLSLLYQLLEVLCVLQENRIVHRDIKGDNIFLDKCLRPVLGDFGFARSLQNRDGGTLPFSAHSQACAGNAHAWAPEVSRFHRTLPESLPHSVTLDQIYSKSDIFAVGRMFYSLLSPVSDDNSFPQSSVDQPHYDEATIPELPSAFSSGLRYVLKQMVLDEPKDRPTPREALLRVGVLIVNPGVDEVSSRSDVARYCKARMLRLLALDPRKLTVPDNVLTIDESVQRLTPEIEGRFLADISPDEFWDVLVKLRHNNLLPSASNECVT